jgi:hypothetical protein
MEEFGNPHSAEHDFGHRAAAIEAAAGRLASVIGALVSDVTSTRNWAHQPYVESTSTPEQWFQAEAGEADLMFFPRRQGELIVRAFEDGADPVFERRMRVIQAARWHGRHPNQRRGSILPVP